MALTIVTEPTIEPLDLEELEDHLRLSETSTGAEDTILLGYLEVARRACEKEQGRAYLDQTWDLTLDDWPTGDCIEIPRPPLQSVTHIKYYGTGNTANTMTAANYYVDTDGEPGRVCLAYGETWPSETLRPDNGVVVRFVAGYGSTQSTVPAEIKQAIKLMVGTMYERRESTDIKEVYAVPDGVHSLLALDRVWPV